MHNLLGHRHQFRESKRQRGVLDDGFGEAHVFRECRDSPLFRQGGPESRHDVAIRVAILYLYAFQGGYRDTVA